MAVHTVSKSQGDNRIYRCTATVCNFTCTFSRQLLKILRPLNRAQLTKYIRKPRNDCQKRKKSCRRENSSRPMPSTPFLLLTTFINNFRRLKIAPVRGQQLRQNLSLPPLLQTEASMPRDQRENLKRGRMQCHQVVDRSKAHTKQKVRAHYRLSRSISILAASTG